MAMPAIQASARPCTATNFVTRIGAAFGVLPGSAIFIPLFQHKDHAAQHVLAYYNGGTPEGRVIVMAEVTIEARPNGPYVVTGTVELHDTNGNVLATQTRTVLCRCGASTKKPFCDGTHSKIGFQAAAQAVPDSAEKS